jgi:hypothetical protein
VAAALGIGVAAVVSSSRSNDTPALAGPEALGALFTTGDGRYIGADSPADLADVVEEEAKRGSLVIRGVVDGFAQGRTFGVGFDYPEDPGIPTVVMAVRVSEILDGELPDDNGGMVYVEFDAGFAPKDGEEPLSALADGVPAGTETVLYLEELGPNGIYPEVKITDQGAGLPANQPLYRVFNPQGFYLESEADGIVQPQDTTVYPNSSLEDFEPSADEFPEGEFAPEAGPVGGGTEVSR